MARKPMITRTLKTYKAKCIIFVDADNSTMELEITTTTNTDKARQAVLREGNRLIKTISVETEENLVGMTVDEFMQYAKPVTRGKAENEENEENV